MRLLVLVLIGLLVWFGLTIIRLENRNYAMTLGMCEFDPLVLETLIERERCLSETQTRTSAWWHLYYALLGETG